MSATDIARALADRIGSLAPELLPGGRREGCEWRAGSVGGEAGHSLGVHLTGERAGVWCDFAGGEAGDALDLVRAALGLDMPAALAWSQRWLGIDPGAAELPRRPVAPPAAEPDPERWRRPWQMARPIASTLAATYLAARRLRFDDPEGRALRFAPRRARLSPDGELERRPAMLALLRDARTGEPCGIISTYLAADGRDRLRDSKGRTVTGRARGAAVMLDAWDEPTMGLAVSEGIETGIALYMSDLRPIWACGGAGTLATLPVLGGIESLMIAADSDTPGRRAAEACAERWRRAGREASIVAAMPEAH